MISSVAPVTVVNRLGYWSGVRSGIRLRMRYRKGFCGNGGGYGVDVLRHFSLRITGGCSEARRFLITDWKYHNESNIITQLTHPSNNDTKQHP